MSPSSSPVETVASHGKRERSPPPSWFPLLAGSRAHCRPPISAGNVADHDQKGAFVPGQDGLDGKAVARGNLPRALVPLEDVEANALGVVSLERELEHGVHEAMATSATHAIGRKAVANVERAGLLFCSGNTRWRAETAVPDQVLRLSHRPVVGRESRWVIHVVGRVPLRVPPRSDRR